MAYDPEKYREKREKVLGIKKRGIGFGALAMAVSFLVIAGLGAVTIPQAVSYMTTRNLDDAIFRLESGASWPDSIISEMNAVKGVATTVKDRNDTRLVITYDRRKVTTSGLKAFLDRNELKTTLLNEVNHRQHQATMKNEGEEVETP